MGIAVSWFWKKWLFQSGLVWFCWYGSPGTFVGNYINQVWMSIGDDRGLCKVPPAPVSRMKQVRWSQEIKLSSGCWNRVGVILIGCCENVAIGSVRLIYAGEARELSAKLFFQAFWKSEFFLKKNYLFFTIFHKSPVRHKLSHKLLLPYLWIPNTAATFMCKQYLLFYE